MMANLSERDRRTLRLGGFGVAAILLYVLAVNPALDYWDRLNRDLTDWQKKLQAIQTGLDERVAAQKALKRLRETATVHEAPEHLNQQTAGMLQQVESLPGYGTLSVKRLEGMPLRLDTEFYRSAVTLQFSGSLRNLHQFLQQVETAKPALKVERLTLAANRDDSSRVEGQMVIAGYAVVMGKGKRG